MGPLSGQRSFEGGGIRQHFTICCQSGGHNRCQSFLLCVSETNFLPDNLTGKLCSLLRSLPPSPLLVKTVSICSVFEITLSHQTKTPFIWLRAFYQRWQKRKKKNKTTHSFLNSAQNITLSNLPLVNDNHKDEQNHQTEYKATLFFFSIWSMRSSQCWSTHPVRPRRSLAFQTISRSLDLQEVKNFKASWSFPLESHGSRYNFHFNDELGGN